MIKYKRKTTIIKILNIYASNNTRNLLNIDLRPKVMVLVDPLDKKKITSEEQFSISNLRVISLLKTQILYKEISNTLNLSNLSLNL